MIDTIIVYFQTADSEVDTAYQLQDVADNKNKNRQCIPDKPSVFF